MLLLLAGNVMEPSSIVLIMAPILFPVAMKLGIDPVHFGIIMTVNMEVGMCHPPVGLNLYVASGITKMGITELTIAVWPWLITMLVFLVMRHLLAGDVDLAAASLGDDALALWRRGSRGRARSQHGRPEGLALAAWRPIPRAPPAARGFADQPSCGGSAATLERTPSTWYNFEFTRNYLVGAHVWR